MTIPDANIPTARVTKRGRKPKTSSQVLLANARKHLKIAQERHNRALAQVDHERTVELAQTGRQIYLGAIEKLHAGERALIVNPLLDILLGDERTAVQTWLDSLSQA